MSEDKKTKKITKVVVKRDLCIGAGSCIAVAPEAYEFDAENIAVLKPEWTNYSDEELLLSAQVCPTLAIFLYDEDGNQIFPE